MLKIWHLQPPAPKEFINRFPEFDPLVLQLLYNRGVTSQEKIDEFFNPDYGQDLFDPFLLSDMEKACDRIEQAVLKKERVAIFGDYDADGVTSSVILTDFLKNVLGLSGQVYIPDRQSEGYGLNKKALDWLLYKKIKLVITCDCGVSNKEEIDYGKSKGFDFIVLDHHHLHQKFSDDYIIINPKKSGDKYPFKELAACGVVFKFIQAFLQAKNPHTKNFGVGVEKWLLDLVAIGTVADCVPLISENRTLVKYGLTVLSKTKRIGLAKLMEKAGIQPENLDTYALSFLIAPRINAAGRIDHATTAYKLLATKNTGEAEKISQDLEEKNYHRQKLCDEIILEAKEIIGKVKKERRILWAAKEKWPLGILGLAAGKICEEFSRPVFILSKGEKESTGSVRSIPQFNIIEAITKSADLLLEYGGHKQAAGLSLENKNLEIFFDRLEDLAAKQLSDLDLIPTINVDAPLDFSKLDFKFYEELQKLEPHGLGNPKPIFAATSIKVENIQLVGYDHQHLKIFLSKPLGGQRKVYEAIGFNQAQGVFQKINKGDLVDIVFELNANIWNGQRKLELKVLDFKKH
ncbi:MAG: single-stranded-DNA-specific exonuclease RecJ [Patescibacteria group bacterium]